MAKITKYDGYEEFYGPFIQVEGKRGTILIFAEDVENVDELANDLAAVLDGQKIRN